MEEEPSDSMIGHIFSVKLDPRESPSLIIPHRQFLVLSLVACVAVEPSTGNLQLLCLIPDGKTT